MNTTKTLFCATLAAATLAAAPVAAHDTKIATTVEHRDLDLTTASGAAELERRIKVAMLRLCGNYDRTDNVGQRPLRQCHQSARLNHSIEAIVTQAQLDAAKRRETQVAAK